MVAASFDTGSRRVVLPFDLEEAYATLVSEKWRQGTQLRQLSSEKLAFYYRVKRLVPRRLQIRARRRLARWQGVPEFPRWPLDRSVAELLRFYVRCSLISSGQRSLRFRWFWPDARAAAVVLTHDVESAAGLKLTLELAALEEDRGLRSSFNIVSSWYPIDMGIIRELQDRGFEIGLHGIHHDRSMFSSRESFESQLEAVAEGARKLGAEGFRSPATHRVYEWLAELPVLYDCSIPHSDPYEPQPGGCCSVWPFFIGDVVELPYTLPQDHTLFTVLGHKTIDVWRRQVEGVVELNGLVQCVTHPDPGYLGDRAKRALYADFLDALRQRDDVWYALPREVAAWWRQRDAGDASPWSPTVGVALLDENDVILEPEKHHFDSSFPRR
jgi:peptidoglycan/xylan/chitin deacetylase (PgdA/CDA1 family)